MRPTEARRTMRRLLRAEARRRMLMRALAWMAWAALVWSLALLSSVCFDYPEPYFHAAVMAALGALPAFVFHPFPETAARGAVRRVDDDSSIEAWLDYGGGPASRLLEEKAALALRVAELRGFSRPRPSRRAAAIVAAMAACALACLVAAESLSLAAGYGLSLSYPDKASSTAAAVRQGDDGMADSMVAAGSSEEGTEAPLAGEGRGRGDEGAGGPDTGLPGMSRRLAEDPTTEAFGDGEPERGAAGGGPEPGSGAREGGKPGSGGRVPQGDEEGTGSGGESTSPGYEGTGRALSSSPLVDYRSRFEREYASAVGTESALGSAPTAESVTAAIAEYYASFDARLAVYPAEPEELIRLKAAWLSAFGAAP